MTASLLVLCVAAAALIASAVSAITGAGLALGRHKLAAQSPASQARVLLAVALSPAVATFAIMAAALAPLFGWVADHCVPGVQLHSHPHICAHHEDAAPALPIAALAGLFVGRLGLQGLRTAWAAASGARAARELCRASQPAARGGARVLPTSEPHAFVLGVVKPSVFISEGLASGPHAEHLGAVLAHEAAHVRRADPLRRLLAGFALSLHLPGVARAVDRRLARAHERAADEDAARQVGSRLRVARALIHVARFRTRAPVTALAFAGSEVEARVRALLCERRADTGPRPGTLWALAVFATCAAAASAGAVHHAVETSLGLLTGSG